MALFKKRKVLDRVEKVLPVFVVHGGSCSSQTSVRTKQRPAGKPRLVERSFRGPRSLGREEQCEGSDTETACFLVWIEAASQEKGPVDSNFQFRALHEQFFLVVSAFTAYFILASFVMSALLYIPTSLGSAVRKTVS